MVIIGVLNEQGEYDGDEHAASTKLWVNKPLYPLGRHQHEDEDTARQHVVESLFNTIGPIIDQSGIGFRDRMRVVESLVGTPEKALSLKRLLEAMV